MSSDSGFTARNPSPQKQWEEELHKELTAILKQLNDIIVQLMPEKQAEAGTVNLNALQREGADLVEGDPTRSEIRSLVQRDLRPEWLQDVLIDLGVIKERAQQNQQAFDKTSYAEKLTAVKELNTLVDGVIPKMKESAEKCLQMTFMELKTSPPDDQPLAALGLRIHCVFKDVCDISDQLEKLGRGVGAAQSH